VEGMYRNEDGGTSSEDIYEDWDQAILQTLKNSPLKVSFFWFLIKVQNEHVIIFICDIL